MNNEEYLKQFEIDVLSKRGNTLRQYFNGHFPRFEVQLNMFQEFLYGAEIRSVLDIGTGTPFTSYYFYLTQGAQIIYGDAEHIREDINSHVTFKYINLCYPNKLNPSDLVICTECIEHLPCPLLPVIDKLMGLTNKYLLLSFPYGGILQGDFNKDFGNHDKYHIHHLREFDKKLSDEFINIINWDIVADKDIYTNAYGGIIRNVLLRKNNGC